MSWITHANWAANQGYPIANNLTINTVLNSSVAFGFGGFNSSPAAAFIINGGGAVNLPGLQYVATQWSHYFNIQMNPDNLGNAPTLNLLQCSGKTTQARPQPAPEP